VLVGVPRCGHRDQPQPAEVDLVAVVQPAVRELAPARGRGEHLRCVVMSQLGGPGQEVGVQVGVGGEPDPQPRLR
jgi:hypothetical protein